MDGENEILSFALSLAGDGADSTLLAAMCAAAAGELEARLREGVEPESLGSVFTTAAGVLALGMYCGIKDAGRMKSFKAGNLSVEYADGEASPETLRRAAEELLSAYLADRGFAFRGVAG